MDTIYTLHDVVFSRIDYYSHNALGRIFGAWIVFLLCTIFLGGGLIVFILCTTQYIRGMNSIDTMHYAVFLRIEYYIYYDRSIFKDQMLFILYTT